MRNPTIKELFEVYLKSSKQQEIEIKKIVKEDNFYETIEELTSEYTINKFYDFDNETRNELTNKGVVILYHKELNENHLALFLPNINIHTRFIYKKVIGISEQIYTHIKKASEELEEKYKQLEDIVQLAEDNNATDIHIQPFEDDYIITFRINKMIINKLSIVIQLKNFDEIINKIYITSKIDTTPQEPNIDCAFECKTFQPQNKKPIIRTYRANIIKIKDKKVSIAIRKQKTKNEINQLTFSKLGYTQNEIDIFNKITQNEKGAVVIAGAVNSGKSTLLYKILQTIHNKDKRVQTIESPIEIKMDFVQTDLTSTEKAIKKYKQTQEQTIVSALRQDIDALSIGEARDDKEIKSFLNIAILGKIAFATLHSGNIEEVLVRLKNANKSTQDFKNSILSIICQQLIPQSCPHCQNVNIDCKHCNNTKFIGILPLVEIAYFHQDKITKDDNLLNIKKLIQENKISYINPNNQLEEYFKQGYISKEIFEIQQENISQNYNKK